MPTDTRCILSDEVSDKIMQLFWEHGYFNISIQDLIAATGYNRASLYKHFGGKQGLFIAMLQRFRNKVVVECTMSLMDPQAGMAGVKTFFQQFVDCRVGMLKSHGCFMVATASNLQCHDPEVMCVVDEFIQFLRGLFYKNLRWQQAEKLIDSQINPEMLADFLVGNVIGMATMMRSGLDNHMLENYVNGISMYLSSLSSRKSASQNNLHVIS